MSPYQQLLVLLLYLPYSLPARLLLTVMDQGRSHATSINTFMHRLQADNHTTALEFSRFHPDIDFGMEERFIDMDGFDNPFASPDFDKIAFEQEYSFMHQVSPVERVSFLVVKNFFTLK